MIKIMPESLFLLLIFIAGFISCYLLNILFSKKENREKEDYFENFNIEMFKEEKKPPPKLSFFHKEEKLAIDDLIKDFLKKNKDNEYLLKKKIQEVIKKAEDLLKEIEKYEYGQN